MDDIIKNVSFRLFVDSDYEEVYSLWIRSGLKLSLSDNKEELLKFAEYNRDSFFLLINNDAIIGAVFAAYDGRRGYINHLAVDPNFQGHGLGKLLMDKSIEYYDSINCVKVHLMIEKDNSQVVEFYNSRDWHIRDDLILMTKTMRDK